MRSWRRRPGRLRERPGKGVTTGGASDLRMCVIWASQGFFFRTRKRETKDKEDKRKMFHELCERGHSRAREGSREGELGCRQGGGCCLSLHLLSLVGWWAGGLVAEAEVPSPGEQANDFGKGQGEGWGYSAWAS